MLEGVFRGRSRLFVASTSVLLLKPAVFDRTCDRVFIFMGDSDVETDVRLVSVASGRAKVFAVRVLRLVKARIDLFS